jgi:hypothetical protein
MVDVLIIDCICSPALSNSAKIFDSCVRRPVNQPPLLGSMAFVAEIPAACRYYMLAKKYEDI